MKKLSTLAALACMTVGPLLATSASAQFAKPEDAIKYRQSALTLMASHFGRMAPVVKGQQPYDAAQIKAKVEVLKTLSALRRNRRR
jgi:cytochrome c556